MCYVLITGMRSGRPNYLGVGAVRRELRNTGALVVRPHVDVLVLGDVLLSHDVVKRGSRERRQANGRTDGVHIRGTTSGVARHEPRLSQDELILRPRHERLPERELAPHERVDNRWRARRRWRRAPRRTHGHIVLIRAGVLSLRVQTEVVT